MRVLVLVDGEHYPPVTRWGIEAARERGFEPVLALLLGGIEKLGAAEVPELGVPVRRVEGSRAGALAEAIDEQRPEGVLDLSDEPIVGYRERMELASVALARGVSYLGPDFRFDPPVEGPPIAAPTLAVIGTGKRAGKTAIAGEIARIAADRGLDPVVVAMGRGGPAEPEVAEAGSVTLETLFERVRRGEHAASDYLEVALTSGVTTVGARRAGGGLGGRPMATNVREAAELAAGLGAGVVIVDGSGAAVPSVPWDAGILVVPATVPPEYLGGYLGPLRLLLSDLVVVTMANSPAGLENIPTLRSHVERLYADARLIVTDFEPQPLGDVRGRDVFFTTTAPEAVAERQVALLERSHGCRVVGWSARLADRAGLTHDLEGAEAYDVLLTEIKAAAVDVASDRAVAAGAEVIFTDNTAVAVDGTDLPAAFAETLDLARERRDQR
ncbi:MAG TPA: 2,3-diphosphoglycerate synthetase [Actinomycetota bacterium]|jgi:cyclic 2,3-diphosphoglycerate synthase|nr:2,3-diphosphoglycerate synthetase [Actinomycetota bacterium]